MAIELQKRPGAFGESPGRGAAGWPVAVVLLTALALVRIVSTYRVFNQIMDEPFHLGCGMEWLQKGTYTLEPLHPPLARVAVALLPYLSGLRIEESPQSWIEGNRVLYARPNYLGTLALARFGTLPFFLLAVGSLWWLARELFSELTAVASVLLFTLLPPILAHAGLATTDMAVTATVLLTVATLLRWLKERTPGRAALCGLSAGLALLSKLSVLVFVPACFVGIALAYAVARPRESDPKRRPRRSVRGAHWIVIVAFLTLWAGYRFSLHPTRGTTPPKSPGVARSLYGMAARVPLPAAEFLTGLHQLWDSQQKGRRAYLLGQAYLGGRWYFFPVAIFYKTPLAFLVLAVIGGWLTLRGALRRRAWMLAIPAGCALAMLAVSLPSRINIGVRHVLPLYPFLALLAGYALAQFAERAVAGEGAARRAVAAALGGGLLLWCAVASARAHPDYLAYFNEAAGVHPENILVDSDLDWGQDLLRLGPELRARGVQQVSIAYFGSARLDAAHLPAFHELKAGERATGWVAASVWEMKMGDLETVGCGGYCWLNDYPAVATIGRSIKLLYVPPPPPTLPRPSAGEAAATNPASRP